MKRDVEQMSKKRYDLIVIGGGITGASVAWDASLRGLKVALIEKGDFGSATSSATSKLVHGGLRYLKHMELGLVRESLQERRIMEIIAPHLVYPIPFIFPAYGWGVRGLPAIVSAMVFYDTLSYDRKWLDDDDKKIPAHEKLSVEKTLELEPGINPKDLKGAVLYYDCQMYSPERLVLEFVLSACEYGADIANHTKVEDIIRDGDTVRGVVVRDILTDRVYNIEGDITMNVAGPWADIIMGQLRGRSQHGLVRSKGIHIITRPITKSYALALQTPDGRHFFIAPWRGHSLLGTTDEVFKGMPDEFRVTEKDIDDFIDEVNETYPYGNLTREDVKFFYGGLRPIVEKDTSIEVEVYDASRKYEIYDHEEEDGIKGFISGIGGKYTTSRNMARKLVDLVYKKTGRPARQCLTHTTPLYGGQTGRFRSFVERALKSKPDGLSEETVENLCRNYGSRYREVVDIAFEKKSYRGLISEGFPDIMAEVIYAVRSEMALSLSDVVFRRTGIGTLGNPGDKALEKIANAMAKELGWDNARKDKEIERVLDTYELG
ncbi:MAG: glycerol-3-phosphate dehydrogenase/oxidase [Deltaproteobacteria bacterium]|nr:glycerol-3-phosphate dehydrogenase/oxidase [Deltaproteobacteria bacterium]